MTTAIRRQNAPNGNRSLRSAGIAFAALAVLAGLLTITSGNTPVAQADPYIPCAQWQQMHPGWPCIDTPQLPPAPPPGAPGGPGGPTQTTPALPTPTALGAPSSGNAGTQAGALTPPVIPSGNGTPIVPVPGYIPPVVSGEPRTPSESEPEQSASTHDQLPGLSPEDLLAPFRHEAKVWGACGTRADPNKTVRSFDRRTIRVDEHQIDAGQSSLYCGNDREGYFHIQAGHMDKWSATDRGRNWRDNADEAIEATLRNPDVACYRLANNTFLLGHALYEYQKKDGELTGKMQYANVVIDANSGKIITAYPTLEKPRC